jgi:hypothetical protein
MSLVSTYVKSQDGKYYQNPTIYGIGWYICFDDDEPPEFVLAIDDRKLSNSYIIKEIKEQLQKSKIKAEIKSKVGRSGRLFPPLYKRFRKASRVFIEIEKPIDLSKLTIVSDSVVNDIKHIDCVVYDFSK